MGIVVTMPAGDEAVVGAMDGPDGEMAAQAIALAQGEPIALGEALYLDPALFFAAVYGGPLTCRR
jgi:hypothetical protein